ncbi:MAG: hypothetical protein IPK65_11890 [Gammaproteobacteria bacterium]|nr:hypothetical protein [Gammaproteobacteria bacterium]
MKWDEKYRERHGIDYQFVRTPARRHDRGQSRSCAGIYRTLDLSGYAHRPAPEPGRQRSTCSTSTPTPPCPAPKRWPLSAEKAGMTYAQFIQRLLNLGLSAFKNR